MLHVIILGTLVLLPDKVTNEPFHYVAILTDLV